MQLRVGTSDNSNRFDLKLGSRSLQSYFNADLWGLMLVHEDNTAENNCPHTGSIILA